ncbi:DUF1883 domain-containing protein [Yersinia aldovae]|uniref:Domain of uncharacterized function (DUF1883) n=1 Tax=Yersinia aldovae TaxID=29483 RepID=A0ABM9T1K7_YERAL|nr:DUF1883 domain-containing protein [Yersinia aldovae]CNL70285.1 Domain of uncharacterised function (DUF1883) [Yersinia aldovae]
MKYTHTRLSAFSGDHIKIIGEHCAIIMLLSDRDYEKYSSGLGSIFHGDFFANFPAQIKVPSDGYWNVLIHPSLPDRNDIEYSVKIVKMVPSKSSDCVN